jgi:hypothetical protein
MRNVHNFTKFLETFVPKKEAKLQEMLNKRVEKVTKLLTDPKFKERIEYSLNSNEINDALYDLQHYIGVFTGDFASIYFSNRDIDDEWSNMTREEKMDVLARYVASELNQDFFIDDLHTSTMYELVNQAYTYHNIE